MTKPATGKDRVGKIDKALKSSKKIPKSVAAAPFVATLPAVNLLPAKITEDVAVARMRRFAAMGAGAAILLVLVVWLIQGRMISSAENTLAEENSRSAAATSALNRLAPIKTYYEAVEANRGQIQATMSREVLNSKLVKDLTAATPSGVSFQSVALALNTAVAPAAVTSDGAAPTAPTPAVATSLCPSPDPFAAVPTTAGCITIAGFADSRESVGKFVDALNASKTFTQAFVSNTTSGETGDQASSALGFTLTVSVRDTAYSNRYSDPKFLKGDKK